MSWPTFPAYNVLLILVFYCAHQANPKMIKFSSGLVPWLTHTTAYATYNSSRDEQDVEKRYVASWATVLWFGKSELHCVSHSLGFNIHLFSEHLLKEPLLLYWPSVVLCLCWRADFNLIILSWVWCVFVLGFFFASIPALLWFLHIVLLIIAWA